MPRRNWPRASFGGGSDREGILAPDLEFAVADVDDEDTVGTVGEIGEDVEQGLALGELTGLVGHGEGGGAGGGGAGHGDDGERGDLGAQRGAKGLGMGGGLSSHTPDTIALVWLSDSGNFRKN